MNAEAAQGARRIGWAADICCIPTLDGRLMKLDV
jgi:hypothetical protein